MKIIVIQQKMIGDVLTSTILFEALRQKYPDAQLDYLINEHTYPVVKNNPYIDNFILLTPEIEKNYSKLYSFIKQIKKYKYDVIIDVYGKISSNLVTLFSGAKIKIGYHKKHTSFIYNRNIKRLKKPENNLSLAIENRLRLLSPLQIPFGNYKPKIILDKKELKQAKNTLESFKIKLKNPLYMISVLGSSTKKTYPAKYMAKLLDYIILNQPRAQLLFNYIPNQIKEAKAVYSLCSQTTQKQIFFELFGNSIREFLALTSHCNALIGNEGGAVNMAKALKKPTFIIFNPSLNKSNWFGSEENNKNSAVHLSDFIAYKAEDYNEAKQNPNTYYLKFKPKFIEPKLSEFLREN
jgi:heptosyltransferase-2